MFFFCFYVEEKIIILLLHFTREKMILLILSSFLFIKFNSLTSDCKKKLYPIKVLKVLKLIDFKINPQPFIIACC